MTFLSAIVVLTNLAYTAAYDTCARCPAWVQYELVPSEIVVTNRPSMSFRADPRVAESDNSADYSGSGFDRGHMAPAADFNFDMDALAETYYFSNVCPQVPKVNRGEWAGIEAEVRDLAKSFPVNVLTGPMVLPGNTNRIGRILVPDAFLKIAWGAFGLKVWLVENKE